MKTKVQNTILLMLTTLFVLSCDSLWKVNGSTDISFSVDLRGILPNSAEEVHERSVNSRNSIVPFEEGVLTVSLFNAKTNKVLQSYTNASIHQLDTTTFNVVFEDVRVGTEVYASVIIEEPMIENGEMRDVFNARSESATVRNSTLELMARPYAVFLDTSFTDPNSNGLTPYSPVSSMQEAVSILGEPGKRLSGATVYAIGPIHVIGSETWNYPGLIVKPWGVDVDALVEMNNSVETLVVDGITFDGSGVTNKGINIGSGNVSVRNTTIVGTNQAIFINGGSILELAGGTTRIHANTKNLVYSSGDARVYLSYALGNGSLIGLSPASEETATLVIAEDISFLNKNYFFLDAGVPGALNVTPLGLEYNKDGDDGDDGDDGGGPPEPPVVASVFLDPQYTSGNSDGTDAAPYTSMEDAVDAIKNFSVENPTTIHVMNPIYVTSSVTWDYPGLTLQLGFDDGLVEMIQVSGNGTILEMRNITLDGNGNSAGLITINTLSAVEAIGTNMRNTQGNAIYIPSNGNFEMTEGEITNTSVYAIHALSGASITINSGKIEGSGFSGIYLENNAILTLRGGTFQNNNEVDINVFQEAVLDLESGNPIIIEDGISFNAEEGNSDIKLRSNIHIDSSIKILSARKNVGEMLVQSFGGTINVINFPIEDPDDEMYVNGLGHLIYGPETP